MSRNVEICRDMSRYVKIIIEISSALTNICSILKIEEHNVQSLVYPLRMESGEEITVVDGFNEDSLIAVFLTCEEGSSLIILRPCNHVI